MTQQLYVVVELAFPRGRKQVIGPVANLKTIRVTQLTTEAGQLPVMTEIHAWAPASGQKPTTKKAGAKKVAAKRGQRVMSAATKAKISKTQRKRHAEKTSGATAAG
jgi:hypothetical protein